MENGVEIMCRYALVMAKEGPSLFFNGFHSMSSEGRIRFLRNLPIHVDTYPRGVGVDGSSTFVYKCWGGDTLSLFGTFLSWL